MFRSLHDHHQGVLKYFSYMKLLVFVPWCGGMHIYDYVIPVCSVDVPAVSGVVSVRSPALPDFLSSSGSGTGSTQPREVKLRSYLNKKVAAPGSENRD